MIKLLFLVLCLARVTLANDFDPSPFEDLHNENNTIVGHWNDFKQPLDHFNASITITFFQVILYNSTMFLFSLIRYSITMCPMVLFLISAITPFRHVFQVQHRVFLLCLVVNIVWEASRQI